MNQTYKVKYWVENNTEAAPNGRVIEMPIIPREGDYVNLEVKLRETASEIGVYEVKRVYINKAGKKHDAEVHVTLHSNS